MRKIVFFFLHFYGFDRGRGGNRVIVEGAARSSHRHILFFWEGKKLRPKRFSSIRTRRTLKHRFAVS